MDGFLSVVDAAELLKTSPSELSQEIIDGRIVAIVKDGQSWLSLGEVSRIAKGKERDDTVALVAPPNPTSSTPSPPPSPQNNSQPAPVAPSGPEQTALREQSRILSQRNKELEVINKRLKSGLQETEASLRRSRNARANLENDVIGLQENLKKNQSRTSALEREVQHLSSELERTEEQHNADLRRLRYKDRSEDPSQSATSSSEAQSDPELASLREEMAEKDRIISQEYQERAVLRAQLEDRNQKYFELKAKYDKEKAEWSEILARELQAHGHLRTQIEELRPKNQKGWNPFRRDK